MGYFCTRRYTKVDKYITIGAYIYVLPRWTHRSVFRGLKYSWKLRIREYMTLVARKANLPPLSSFISLMYSAQGITNTTEVNASLMSRVRLAASPCTKRNEARCTTRHRDIERAACISRAAGLRIERQVDAWIKYRPVNDRQVDYEISLKSRTVGASVNRYFGIRWINCWQNISIALDFLSLRRYPIRFG